MKRNRNAKMRARFFRTFQVEVLESRRVLDASFDFNLTWDDDSTSESGSSWESAPEVVSCDVCEKGAEMAELARQDLAAWLEIPAADIEVRRIEEVVWPDSCLGDQSPDEVCLMVITPGFNVSLDAGGQEYEYHTDQRSSIVPVDAAMPDSFRVPMNTDEVTFDVMLNDHPGILFARRAEISEVGTPSHGGRVIISEDGGSLRYTPAADFTGYETFRYALDSNDSATVTVHVYDPRGQREVLVPDEFKVLENSREISLDVMANDFAGIQFIRAPDITSVTAPSGGGVVTIAEGGGYLLYTPPATAAGNVVRETFTYTVDHGASAEVTVQVHPADGTSGSDGGAGSDGGEMLVATRLDVVDANGKPVTRVDVGQTIFVNIYVRDLRAEAFGVFSMYLDLEFDPRIVAVSGDFNFSAQYSNAPSGEVQAGLIDELGAFSRTIRSLDDAEYLLVSVPFKAVRRGELDFSTNAADSEPAHAIGLYGLDDMISTLAVEYDSASVTVVNRWHNLRLATDVNNDDFTTPMDALAVINQINDSGIGELHEFYGDEVAALADGSSVYCYDVSEDGYLTALDALNVINALNFAAQAGQSDVAGEAMLAEEPATEDSMVLGNLPIDHTGEAGNGRVGDENAPGSAVEADEAAADVWIVQLFPDDDCLCEAFDVGSVDVEEIDLLADVLSRLEPLEDGDHRPFGAL